VSFANLNSFFPSIFTRRKHLYIDMEKIYRVWEIELQAVLEINKIGHRKRILYSLIGQRIEPPNIEEINEDSCSNNALDLLVESSDNNNTNPPKPVPAVKPTTLSRHKKNRRPAPQPPTQTNNLEIRAPSELLLSNQGSLQAQWKHSAAALVSGSIKYEVFVSRFVQVEGNFEGRQLVGEEFE
jgi:ankyrin repeat and SAM domain-containing protein 1